jgi:hypothetical protein
MKYRAILKFVGVSVACNFQIGKNEIKLITEYESVIHTVSLFLESIL